MGAMQGDAYPAIYRDAIEQLAGLDARLLLNTGRRDPAELGPLPAGVHAERWVHEAAVLPFVAASGAGLVVSAPGGLRRAVSELLTEPAYAGVATAIAAEAAGLPPAGEAIDVLCEALATFAV